MGFVEDWNTAIENDSYWQFEDLLEGFPELAECVWKTLRIKILTRKRLARQGIYL